MRAMPLQSTSKYGYLSLINTANVKNVIFDYNFINHPFINFHFAASLGRKRRVEKMREREREFNKMVKPAYAFIRQSELQNIFLTKNPIGCSYRNWIFHNKCAQQSIAVLDRNVSNQIQKCKSLIFFSNSSSLSRKAKPQEATT